MKLTIDDRRLQKRILNAQREIAGNLPLDLRLAGKRAAFYLMENTLPRSSDGGSWPMANFEKRIDADVRKAFPAIGDTNWQASAYGLIQDSYSKDKADEFWRAHKSGAGDAYDIDTRKKTIKSAESILQSARKVKRRIDPSGYSNLRKSKSVRRGRTLQLAADTKPLALVQPGQREGFARKRKATMGLAKAGYYAADTAFGGQRNYKKADNEAGRFVWPSQLRRLQSKFGTGIGNGRIFITAPGAGLWEVHNRVRYAKEAIPEALYNRAIQLGQNAMRVIFELRLKNRKTYEKAA